MNHTPTPWEIDGNYIIGEIRKDVNGADYICAMESGIGKERDRANQEFIVTACNAHEALVKKLCHIEAGISGSLSGKYTIERGSTFHNDIREALAKAGVQ